MLWPTSKNTLLPPALEKNPSDARDCEEKDASIAWRFHPPQSDGRGRQTAKLFT